MISPYLIPGIIRSIDEIVADSFNVPVNDLATRGQNRSRTEARQFAMWFRYLFTDDGPKKIGKLYKRDHSTVRHAYLTIENLMETNGVFRRKAEKTIQRLKEAGYGKNTNY